MRYALNLRVPSDNHRAGELTFAPGYTGEVGNNGAVTQGYGLATFLLGEATLFNRYVSTTDECARAPEAHGLLRAGFVARHSQINH